MCAPYAPSCGGRVFRVVGVQSELFSHRDKNYTRNRLKELARQTITGDNRLEMELKGCGFTEALYAWWSR